MSNSQDCAHCCCPLPLKNDDDDPSRKIIRKIKSLDKSSIVDSVMSSIYKFHYLEQLQSIDKQDSKSHKDDDENVALCKNCSHVLTTLWTSYNQFNQLGKQNSYLSKKMIKLDTLIRRLVTLVSTINSKDRDTQNDEDMSSFLEYPRDQDLLQVVIKEEKDDTSIDDSSTDINPVRRQINRAAKRGSKSNVDADQDDGDDSKSFTTNDDDYNDDGESTSNITGPSDVESDEFTSVPSSSSKGKKLKIVKKPRKQPKNIARTKKSRAKIYLPIENGVCPLCYDKYQVRNSLTVHLMTHVTKEDGSTNNCPVPRCTQSYPTRLGLMDHISRSHIVQRYSCPVPTCGKFYSNSAVKNQHLQDHVQEKLFICHCDEIFSTKNLLELHQTEKHAATLYKCPACPEMTFTKEHHLNTHAKSAHRGEKIFVCTICSKALTNTRRFVKHVQSHEGLKYCSRNCGKSYPTAKQLKKHEDKNQCEGQETYLCTFCGQSMKKYRAFREHMKIHEAGKGFKCTHPNCNKSFLYPSGLERHVKIHGDDSHTCDQCGQSFKLLERLRKHLLVHSDSKDHLCPHCGSSFKRIECLNRHLKVHSDVKEYPCSLCDKVYKYDDSRRLHFLTAHKPAFSCSLCPSGFPYPFMLKKHMTTAHSGK